MAPHRAPRCLALKLGSSPPACLLGKQGVGAPPTSPTSPSPAQSLTASHTSPTLLLPRLISSSFFNTFNTPSSIASFPWHFFNSPRFQVRSSSAPTNFCSLCQQSSQLGLGPCENKLCWGAFCATVGDCANRCY